MNAPRGDTWTCSVCGTVNEPFRDTCMSANDPAKHPQEGEGD